MNHLQTTLAALRAEPRPDTDHLTVFREFLAQLDELQRHLAARPPRVKSPARRKPARRGRGA